MAILRLQRNKEKARSLVVQLFLASAAALVLLWVAFSTSIPASLLSSASASSRASAKAATDIKYLYWGNRVDCPGKHCDTCAGLGHQESSLRCALDEALFLGSSAIDILVDDPPDYGEVSSSGSCVEHGGVFVMPSGMCINPTHNKKGILHQTRNPNTDEMWATRSCPLGSLYDLDLISSKVPVILDNSKAWLHILSTSLKLGRKGVVHVNGVSRSDLKEKNLYSNVLLINRTASPLAWFMECKDRTDHNSVLLPHDFLPMMASRRLRNVADKIKHLLGDYDAIHVRRGDILKTRKDRFGIERSLHPHLDRDTRPEFIQHRIVKWIPPGRTLFIASNERSPGFFSPLSSRYKLAYSSNFTDILDPVVENNYQLFMVERLILAGARTYVKTYKEDENDLSLTDDPKKNTKNWQIPVYTMDNEGTDR
ncbi:hypothetical protein ZIOFF_015686 [Zingiber officinale]|uniref:O-fucosyltransferase family protein n=1 Tax=Zingiber officinale TaxID=94328 RepID=A0A8J5LU49_ZINOF|nr:hypothetical protein ZIOFF_015686 [Zingiber officinale]